MQESLLGKKLDIIVMGFWLGLQKVNLGEGKSKTEDPEIVILL
jgi:hypothetical protein